MGQTARRITKEQLANTRPFAGQERKVPSITSRIKRLSSLVIPATDPVKETKLSVHIAKDRNSYLGQEIVRDSGIVEQTNAIPLVRSAEAVRTAMLIQPEVES